MKAVAQCAPAIWRYLEAELPGMYGAMLIADADVPPGVALAAVRWLAKRGGLRPAPSALNESALMRIWYFSNVTASLLAEAQAR